MFFRREKKDLISIMEERYKKKEITKRSLCGDVYETGKIGILTTMSGFICLGSSTIFSFGMYSVYDRFSSENPAKLADGAGWLIFGMGLTAIASAWGTKQLAKLTMGDYELFKKHHQEYRERIEKSKA